MRLRSKLFVAIALVELLLYGAIFVYITDLSSRQYREAALSAGRAEAATASAGMASLFLQAASTVDALRLGAETLHREGRRDRSLLTEFLAESLRRNKAYYAFWAAFAPNAWDGADARYAKQEEYRPGGAFVPWAHRQDGQVLVQAGMEGDEEGYYGDFFTIPVKTGRSLFVEPYEEAGAEGEDSVLMTTYTAPVLDAEGRALGAIGVDLALDSLSSLLKADTLGKGSYAFLASGGGLILGHGSDPSLVGKEVSLAVGEAEASHFSDALAPEGRDYLTEDGSAVRILHPLALPGSSGQWIYCLSVPTATIYAPLSRLKLSLLAIFGLGLLLSVATLYLVSLRLTSPLKGIGLAFGRISEGDLATRVDRASRDEFGDLAREFNEFSETLATLFASLREATRGITASGASLQAATARSREALAGIRSLVDQSKAELASQATAEGQTRVEASVILQGIVSLEEGLAVQAASIAEAASSVEEMVGSISSVAHNAETMGAEMGDLDKAAQLGKERLEAVIDAIAAVEGRSSDLEEANEVIAEVASRTNLLAMNAAIEAAHAGEAGKGFAVVADEIRALAESSRIQSGEISGRVAEIRAGIDAASASSVEAGSAFDEVLRRLSALSRLEGEVGRAVIEQHAGGRLVLEALGKMQESSGAVEETGRDMAAAGGEVKAAIDRLEEASARVNACSIDIAGKVEEIEANGETSLGLAAENGRLLESFERVLARFRT